MSRSDSASITFSVNVPPEAIREYFDGLAKVETAKRPAASTEKGFDWSSLLNLAPVLLPFLLKSIDSKVFEPTGPSVRVPESKSDVRSSTVSDAESKPDIVISFVQKPSKDAAEADSVKDAEDSETSKSSDSDATSTVEDKKDDVSEKKSEAEASRKRPVYQDGDNVVVDLKDFASGGLGDMMKMFAPMMEGLMGNMGGMMPKVDAKTESKSESKTDSAKEVGPVLEPMSESKTEDEDSSDDA